MSSADEARLINGLFDRLEQAEKQTSDRDASASQLIEQRIQHQPAAPYYMAQTILIQEAALKRLTERVEVLEQQAQSAQQQQSSGGFLAGLFGGGSNRNNPAPTGNGSSFNNGRAPAAQHQAPSQPGWGSQNAQPQGYAAPQGGGRSFLAGALQTATGVAGGVVLGNMLTNLFSGHSGEEIVHDNASNLSDSGYDQGYDQGLQDASYDAGYDDSTQNNYGGDQSGYNDQGFDDQGFSDDNGGFGDDDF